jgi:hypothetical protein
MSLPIFKMNEKSVQLLQTTWASQLNPIVGNAVLKGLQLDAVSLINGVTIINHLLSRKQQGWFITDVNAAATIYRSAPFNDTTLTLSSNADCVVNIWVY